MYTLSCLLRNDLIRLHIRDLLFYSTKAKRTAFKKNRSQSDPGIKHRVNLLNNPSAEELEDIDIDGLESDFMNANLSHKEYIEELNARKEREKYFIVQQKYFKEKIPNFLTYNDKLQIKYLHRTDPEQWTVQKLSDSFPALPNIVSKILKTNWIKKNINRIKRHDEAVYENWEKFKKGELVNIPRDVVEHLRKFTNRELSTSTHNANFYEPDIAKNIEHKPKLVKTEFSDIITSYEKLTTKQNKDTNLQVDTKLLKSDKTYNITQCSSRKRVTLPQLKKEIETAVQGGKELTEAEILILREVQTQNENHQIVELKESITSVQKLQEKKVQLGKIKKDYSFLEYPLKIQIPNKVFKKGFIYKLNDCYYDDRGIFLYRVPGMNS